jgi:outer membrane protein assembly factor BamB
MQAITFGSGRTMVLRTIGLIVAVVSPNPPLAAFDLPNAGCPMAHCDGRMSDRIGFPAPVPGPGEVIAQIWHRTELTGEATGSQTGLGCSGNGTVVACSYGAVVDNLVVYDYDGNRIWRSNGVFRETIRSSAPLVSSDGDVIAADDEQVVRFDGRGWFRWRTRLVEGGKPISPVLTDDGILVLATAGGPIYAVDSEDGRLLDILYVRMNEQDSGFFETINTPAVNGNRVYVSMHYRTDSGLDPKQTGRLVAIDVDRAGSFNVLTPVWHFEFGGLSAASPLRVGRTIFFDGYRPEPGTGPINPHLFAVVDTGSSPRELWRQPIWPRVVASFSFDPRLPYSFWTFGGFTSKLLRLDLRTGALLDRLDVNALLGESNGFLVTSVTAIAGSAPTPILLVGVTKWEPGGPSYLLAIDVESRSLAWRIQVGEYGVDGIFGGQFPILLGDDGPRVVFSSRNSGARAVGVAPLR